MRKRENFQYCITINEEHMRVLIDALDAYTRLGLGQFKYVLEHMFPMDVRREDIALLLDTLHINLLNMPVNASRGIGNKDMPNEANIAYEIGKTLECHRSWKKHPEGGHTVNFHDPLHVSGVPFPVVKDVKNTAKTTTGKR